MKTKILWQLMDALQGSLSQEAILELALRALVWAKYFGSQAPYPDQSLQIREQLAASGHNEALVQQAFPDNSKLETLNPTKMQAALDIAQRLQETGILETLEPADLISTLPSNHLGEAGLPSEVCELMVGLADCQSADSVYTPWDFTGQLASRSAAHLAMVYLETPHLSPVPALISLLSASPFEVHYSDPIRKPTAIEAGKLRQFDKSIAFPPLGLRYGPEATKGDWFERFPERTSSGSIISIRHLLAQTRQRIVVAVPNALLFSTGGELALRQDLLRRGQLEAVIALPAGLLGFTNIAFAIIILNPEGGHQQVRFINADAPSFYESVSKAKTRLTSPEKLIAEVLATGDSEHTATVLTSEILNNDAQLQVDRYVLPEAKKRLAALLKNSETVILSDLVTTIRPVKPVSDDEETIDAWEVGAADLPPNGYIRTPSRTIKVPARLSSKARQQFLQPLDIILIVKGSVGKVGIVPPDVPRPGESGWVAGGSAIVLRLTDSDKADARTLFMQLRSPIGQELLNGIVSGATIPLIQLRELAKLAVLVPDLETSKHAAETFERETELQHQIDQLKAEQAALSGSLWRLDE